MAETSSAEQLRSKKCVPCEGGVPRLTSSEISSQLEVLSGWSAKTNPDRISKSWVVKNFLAGMEFLNAVAALAETEGHHPDVHLSGYRNVCIEIWTHAIDGLSTNDFILAAKIDQLPVKLKSSPAS